MQSIRFVCKFNMRGAFYPHPGVRSPPAWTNSFYVFTCHCWSCVLYISVTDGVCTGKCFLTEIYSNTQLMQKYRDISLKGGFLPHATLYSKQPIFGLTQEWFRELYCGVHDKLHISSADRWDLLLHWHRHQIEWTNGF